MEATRTNAPIILCDRSVIDPVAYVEAAGDPSGARELLGVAECWLDSYAGLIVLSPMGVPYKQDDVRRETRAFRERVHRVLLRLLGEVDAPYVEIWGEFDDRVTQVCRLIGGRG
jgi:nicotinamide riboside kinase